MAWRERHIRESQFMYLLALVVGILCGLAAQLLKFLIHAISTFLNANISSTSANFTYLIYPVVGILIVTLFVKYVVKDNISHGVTKVLYAISQSDSADRSEPRDL